MENRKNISRVKKWCTTVSERFLYVRIHIIEQFGNWSRSLRSNIFVKVRFRGSDVGKHFIINVNQSSQLKL